VRSERIAAAACFIALVGGGLVGGILGAGGRNDARASQHAVAVSPTGNDSACRRGNVDRPCATFQRAYELARPGDTVAVRAGRYPANDPARDAITIFGSPRSGTTPVTFACASKGAVTTTAVWFAIKAFNVKLSGSCFRLHGLRIGEGDDTSVTTRNVRVEGVKIEGVEVVGAQRVVLRNVEIGPAVYCHAQGTQGVGTNGGPITPAMWCDPAGAPYEAFYANRGNADLRFESFIHNNAGGINPTLLMEGSYVHDIQSKDAFNMHTACALIWTIPGAPANSLVFRGNRFENCAVLGILVESADGVTIEDNVFGYPTEPLSNGRGDRVEAPPGNRELVLKTGNGWSPRNWLIRFNSFSHGLSLDDGQTNSRFQNVVVRRNILGRYSYCPAGVVFRANLFLGRVCAANSLTVPFGYRLVGRRLVVNARDAATVRLIFRSAAEGETAARIVRNLAQSGRGRWSRSKVRTVLENDFYTGSKVGAPGAHPALVSRATWRRAQKSLSR
jgi:hypothetical protein